jgi:hypothetical protein
MTDSAYLKRMMDFLGDDGWPVAIWHDGREWTFSIDPSIPESMRPRVRKNAIAACEWLMMDDERTSTRH